MLPLLHDHVRRLTELLKASTEALRACTAPHHDLADLAVSFLDRAGDVYRQLSIPEAENEMLALKAQVNSIRSGLHPVTMERVTQHRRNLERAVATRALGTASSRLRTDVTERQAAIDETRERLIPIVSVALQKGLLPSVGHGNLSQSKLETMWHTLCADTDLEAACHQLAMKMSVIDLVILLGDLLALVQQTTALKHPQPSSHR